MRQAITTRFAGPTDHRGSRVIVRAQAGRMVVSWDHALNADENHTVAATKFAEKYGWLTPDTALEGGGLPDGTGNCYVLVDTRIYRAKGERHA